MLEELKVVAKANDLEEQVIFKGKLPYNEMMKYTTASDVGISFDKNTNINYKFSLPNKLFDYIHAGIPVMVTDLVEIKRIVEDYKVGVVLAELTPQTIAINIERLRLKTSVYDEFKENTKRAKQELTWANEKEVLRTIYA